MTWCFHAPQRFGMSARGHFKKLDGWIEFPFDLDLTPYSAWPEASQPTPTTYRLSGVVVHSGGLGAGHYIAYVKTPKGWFYISDSHVASVPQSKVAQCQAYLLFYVRNPPRAAAASSDDADATATV